MRTRSYVMGVCLVMGALALPGHAQGLLDSSLWAFRVYGEITPILGGDVSDVLDAGYDDAFDLGFGGGVEAEYQFNDAFSALLGVGYEVWDGDSISEAGIDASLDDWDIVPLYVGMKYMVPWQQDWFDLYVRADVGAAYLSSVDARINGVDDEIFDSTWSFMGDVGIGGEYHLENFGVFLEIRGRYIDGPDSDFEDIDADGSWSLPIVMGATFRF